MSTIETPPPRAEMCVGCKQITDQPTLVRVVEQSSGAGGMLYACPTCAPRYGVRLAVAGREEPGTQP